MTKLFSLAALPPALVTAVLLFAVANAAQPDKSANTKSDPAKYINPDGTTSQNKLAKRKTAIKVQPKQTRP
ncbi:MAG TPA: hypothetical protein VKG24_19725 [Pseudolabrys sp.]|nr:hypothetical protein [Pseudolabrys sp.]